MRELKLSFGDMNAEPYVFNRRRDGLYVLPSARPSRFYRYSNLADRGWQFARLAEPGIELRFTVWMNENTSVIETADDSSESNGGVFYRGKYECTIAKLDKRPTRGTCSRYFVVLVGSRVPRSAL